MSDLAVRRQKIRRLLLTILTAEIIVLVVPAIIVYAISRSALAGVLTATGALVIVHLGGISFMVILRSGRMPRFTERVLALVAKQL